MKLNLGCGGAHKKGYINIDAFNETIADNIMTATNLDFEDNRVDEILLSQVIEHLGIIKSVYTISECFRVLKPNAKLIIETPDIRASFERYLKGDREIRKNVLPWIYGVDMPGMLHHFCFPDDLLDEILSENGFEELKKDYFSDDPDQPTLRITAIKTSNYETLQFVSKFRKKIVREKLIDFNDQIPSLEKEDLIKLFTNKITELLQNKNKDIMEEIIVEGALKNIEITNSFIEEIINQNLFEKEQMEKYLRILKKLVEIRFIDVLVEKLTLEKDFVGKQEELYSEIRNQGKKIIKTIFASNEGDQDVILNGLKEIIKNFDNEKRIDVFSLKMIMLNANKMFQRGAKEFNLDNYKEAINHFIKAEEMYRDQILTYWNLGRLHIIQKDIEKAMSYYRKALSLIDVIEYKEGNIIRQELETEVRDHSVEKIKNPIISLYEI